MDEMEEIGPDQLSMLNYTRPIVKKAEEEKVDDEANALGININMDVVGAFEMDLFAQEQIDAEADSALHLALTNNAALNVDVILEKMSKIEADASQHFKDIFHELVDYKGFKSYLKNMTKTTEEMSEYKIVRVLKDPSANLCSMICCGRVQFKVNKDDELVI